MIVNYIVKGSKIFILVEMVHLDHPLCFFQNAIFENVVVFKLLFMVTVCSYFYGDCYVFVIHKHNLFI